MCGRFTRYHAWRDIYEMYNLTDSESGRNTEARYNIAPTQDVIFVSAGKDGHQQAREGQWWLVPAWAKADERKYPTFNARSEDAETKSSFRDSFKSKRCLIAADGFYEWTKNPEDGGKDPWHIFLPDHRPFSFAGLWAYNPVLDLTSCTILTATAREPMKKLHNRQPIILDRSAYDAWLDPATPVPDAKALLLHDLDGDLEFYRVGRQVNATRGAGDRADMIEPIG